MAKRFRAQHVADLLRETCGNGQVALPDAADLTVRLPGENVELIQRGMVAGFAAYEHPKTGQIYLSPPCVIIPDDAPRGGLVLLADQGPRTEAADAEQTDDAAETGDDVPDFAGETAAARKKRGRTTTKV